MRAADSSTPDVSRPRVCVALRWRESRSSRASPDERSGDIYAHATQQSPPHAKVHEQSRLCMLRRRAAKRAVLSSTNRTSCKGDGVPADDDAPAIVGLGMRTEEAAIPSQQSPSPRSFDAVVSTPFISVEGLYTPSPGPHEKAPHSFTGGSSSVRTSTPSPPLPASKYTDAALTGELASLIATELQPPPAPRPTSALPMRSGPPETREYREVVTFTTGPQGTGKTAFLLGGVLHSSPALSVHVSSSHSPPEEGRRRASNAPAAAVAAAAATTALTYADESCGHGLFGAVLSRLFAPSAGARPPSSVAVSVVEVRDAAPLQHPSVLQRRRETVDLLSGLRLSVQESRGLAESPSERQDDGRHAATSPVRSSAHPSSSSSLSSSLVVDQPTDIPAACYVRVRSVAEAAAVLHCALLSSTAWQPAAGSVTQHEQPGAEEGDGGAAAATPLVPSGLPQEEKTSHLCLTVLVSYEAAKAKGRVSAAPRRDSRGATDDRPGSEASTAAHVGVWKVWDLAGPSLACGYQPYEPSVHMEVVNNQDAKRGVASSSPRVVDASVPPVLLPWHNRYSLASLTHTCVTAYGCGLEHAPSLLALDTTAMQIAASAAASATLVVPIASLVAEAAMDRVNREVLRSASGWASSTEATVAAGVRQYDRESSARQEHREDNAVAAQCVLNTYAVDVSDFMAERAVGAAASTRHVHTESAAGREGEASRGVSLAVLEGKAVTAANPSSAPQPSRRSGIGQQRELAAAADAHVTSSHAVPVVEAARVDPLSINVTSVEEESAAVVRRVAMAREGGEDGADGRPQPPASAVSEAVQTPVGTPPRQGQQEQQQRSQGHHHHHPRTLPLTSSREAALANLVHTPQKDESSHRSTHGEGHAARPTVRPSENSAANRLSTAALCAAGAVEAEESRLRRFRPLLDAYDVDDSSGAACAASAPASRRDAEPAALSDCGDHGGSGAKNSREEHNLLEETREQFQEERGGTASDLHANAGTPPRAARSPPSVMYTGLRRPQQPATPPAAEGSAEATVDPSPSPHESAARRVDGAEGSLHSSPHALQYESTELSASAQPTNIPAETSLLEGTTRTPESRDAAALVRLLTPYCDAFTSAQAEMCREVAAWRATEAESLQQLMRLAEQHTRDVQQLFQLLQSVALPSQGRDSAINEKGDDPSSSSTGGGVSGVHPTYDGILAPPLSDASAVMASTSALIFEQLVKSEEKVTWLEGQLLQWRQRTHDASALQSSLLREACDGAAPHPTEVSCAGRDGPPPPSSPSASRACARSDDESLLRDAADVTSPHVRRAQRILRRLLLRCGRAYAAAPQRSVRWQEQLAHEQRAKSALLTRVVELEEELAAYRQRGAPRKDTAGWRGPADVSSRRAGAGASEPLGAAVGGAQGGPQPSRSHSSPTLEERLSVPQATRGIVDGAARDVFAWADGAGAHDDVWADEAVPSCSTPAPVSPIRSVQETMQSVPSPCDHSMESPTVLGPALPGSAAVQRVLARGSTASSFAPSAASVVPSELAALLSRAVRGSSREAVSSAVRPFSNTELSFVSDTGGGAAALFDVRVGPGSMEGFAAGEARRGRDVSRLSDEDVVSPLASSLSPSSAPAAAAVAATARRDGVPLSVNQPPQLSPRDPLAQHRQQPPLHHTVSAAERQSGAAWPASTDVPGASGSYHDDSRGSHLRPSPSMHAATGLLPPHEARLVPPSQRAGGSAVATYASHSRSEQQDSETYPTDALHRLQHAAERLAAGALRLSEAGHSRPSSRGLCLASAAQQLQQTLHEGEGQRRLARGEVEGRDDVFMFAVDDKFHTAAGDDDAVEDATQLYASVGALRCASQAVQREAREAAERERAYLSTILFSPDNTPDRPRQ